ncbi:hypothetical protein [Microtetraspora sp. NBRC 13810]|uniref:hypothetical protein n=1 Tax=Microtetraspora sp. NBRC 13810 TaxID=3030990 RepID=UPI0025532765|nr:hypothetical protein [Microtetraspora sp. NBRC 13810]
MSWWMSRRLPVRDHEAHWAEQECWIKPMRVAVAATLASAATVGGAATLVGGL